MRRQRVLRRLLKKYRASSKIDRHLYHELYLRAKGNQYRNKSHLVEYIWKAKGEKQRQDVLEKQAAARQAKALKAKRVARKLAKVAAIGAEAFEEEKKEE